jgi:hypothetical protein
MAGVEMAYLSRFRAGRDLIMRRHCGELETEENETRFTLISELPVQRMVTMLGV